MPYITTTGGLNFQYPTDGTQNWGATLKTTWEAISAHDHTGGNKGTQITAGALASNSITGPKFRLANDEYLRARNAAGSADLSIVKANSSDKLVFGTNISSITIEGGAITGITDLAVADGGTGASTAADARTNLGLGTMATQAASSVAISGGSITGITDLAVADGGTGASTAADARTNLGLGTMATQAASSVTISGGSITGITDLAVADGGTGASTAANARTNLGVGTGDSPTFTGVTVSGGIIQKTSGLGIVLGPSSGNNVQYLATSTGEHIFYNAGGSTELLKINSTGQIIPSAVTRQDYSVTGGISINRTLDIASDLTAVKQVLGSLIGDLISLGLIQ